MDRVSSKVKTIKIERLEHGVVLVTLNRPQRMNAFTEEMGDELISVYNEANYDDSVRVLVITGAGNAFCAGAELLEDSFDFKKRGLENATLSEHRDGGGKVVLATHGCKKPVIGAINGSAVGVGITMTLPMDLRIVSENAKIGFVFNRRGIVMEACSSWFLPRIIGIGKASEWVLTGRVFTAKEEVNSGLFNYVLPEKEVLNKALQIAKDIAINTPAVSTAINKALLHHPLEDPQSTHLVDSKCIFWAGQSTDAKEGVLSFLEKRKPQFQLKVSQDMPDFYPWWKEPKVTPSSKL